MAKLLKLRRGTTSQHSSFTGAEGEVTVDTTKDTIVVHNGSTAGGIPLAKESNALSLIDEDNMATDSATRPPSQQSVKAYADTKAPAILDEDNLGSDSATRPPSQQSVKAYVDGQTLTLIDEDNLGSDSAARPPSQQSVKAYVDTNFAPKASPALTGTATGVNLTLSGNLTVNGTTTTVATTNTTVTDNLLELNSGAGSNANDAGILIERGSTGDNAIIAWDESADKFIVGTTTATNTATGDLTITAGSLVAGAVEDSKGNLRSIPQNTQGSAYTLVAADAGKHILASGTITVPDSVFSAGDAVTIVNNTGSDLTITKTITTMYLGTDASSANRTLSTRGMATILFASGTVAYISGAGLS